MSYDERPPEMGATLVQDIARLQRNCKGTWKYKRKHGTETYMVFDTTNDQNAIFLTKNSEAADFICSMHNIISEDCLAQWLHEQEKEYDRLLQSAKSLPSSMDEGGTRTQFFVIDGKIETFYTDEPITEDEAVERLSSEGRVCECGGLDRCIDDPFCAKGQP